MKRLLLVLFCWVITFNIFISIFILLPYYLIYGKCYWDTLYFKNVNNWYLDLIE